MSEYRKCPLLTVVLGLNDATEVNQWLFLCAQEKAA